MDTLEAAGLIRTELEPASRGLRKICPAAQPVDKSLYKLKLVQPDVLGERIGAISDEFNFNSQFSIFHS